MMLTHIKHIAIAANAIRNVSFRWWGGISCRVAFLVTPTLVLVALLIGILLFWEDKRPEEQEVRDRALWFFRYAWLLAADQFSPKNRHALVSIVNDAFLPEKTLVGKVDHELMSLGLFGSNGRNQMARP